MNWWPFTKIKVDERITHTRNMLYKETYFVVVLICFASMLAKNIYYGQNVSMITTELVLLVVTALYYGIRSIKLGIYSDEVEVHDRKSKLPMNMKNVIWGLCLGVVLATWFGINSSVNYAEGTLQSIWYFILVFFVSLIIYIPIFLIVIVMTHNLAYKVSKKATRKDEEE